MRRKTPISFDAKQVAATFGLPPGRSETILQDARLEIAAGEIVAVVGPSGAGKSVLLREVLRKARGAIRLTPIGRQAARRPAVDALRGGTLKQRLDVLSRCGLAEATALVAPAGQLSDGQRFRLALARTLHKALRSDRPTLIVADEFCSTLDVATAAVLCRQVARLVQNFQKIQTSPPALLLATPRVELLRALQPARVYVKPLGGRLRVEPRLGDASVPLPDPRRWPIVRGCLRDYAALGRFHYLTGPPAAHKRVYVIRTPRRWRRQGGPEIAALLIVSPPVTTARGRNVATFRRYVGPTRREALAKLNAEVECISRVIVHPTYRGAGLAKRLVRHAVNTSPVPVVEALAAMGKMCPFFAAAGLYHAGLFRGRSQYYHYYLSQPPGFFR
ncbi:MAG: AAA family ATPase [Phycisphaerae bacterium]|nr:AAA family ATPase [Phycisphaerae bacterium]